VVARACVQGLYAKRAEFLRTPKTGEHASLAAVLRASWAETVLAALGVLGIVAALTRLDTLGGPLLAALLVVPTLGMAAAPFNSLAAQRTLLPPDLARRRRTEWQRDRNDIVAGTAAGLASLAAVVLVALVAALLTAPSPRVASPNLVQPPQRRPAPTTTPSPTPTPSGTPQSTTTPSSAPTGASPTGAPPNSPSGGGATTTTNSVPTPNPTGS
jgi:hypothetical protein